MLRLLLRGDGGGGGRDAEGAQALLRCARGQMCGCACAHSVRTTRAGFGWNCVCVTTAGVAPVSAGCVAKELMEETAVFSGGSAAPSDGKRKLWANTVDEQGFTLLMEAVAVKDLDRAAATCAVLLQHRANTTAADEDGYTPLHWAAACGNADV
eukprot:COSAG01_NODE_32062_length_587_cov_0.625000_1_plen_153_part_01